MAKDEQWVVDRYPAPLKNVLVDSLYDGQQVGYYDNIADEFRSNQTHQIIPEVKGWQELPDSLVEFVPLKQRILMKGSNLSVVEVGRTTLPPTNIDI